MDLWTLLLMGEVIELRWSDGDFGSIGAFWGFGLAEVGGVWRLPWVINPSGNPI